MLCLKASKWFLMFGHYVNDFSKYLFVDFHLYFNVKLDFMMPSRQLKFLNL